MTAVVYRDGSVDVTDAGKVYKGDMGNLVRLRKLKDIHYVVNLSSAPGEGASAPPKEIVAKRTIPVREPQPYRIAFPADGVGAGIGLDLSVPDVASAYSKALRLHEGLEGAYASQALAGQELRGTRAINQSVLNVTRVIVEFQTRDRGTTLKPSELPPGLTISEEAELHEPPDKRGLEIRPWDELVTKVRNYHPCEQQEVVVLDQDGGQPFLDLKGKLGDVLLLALEEYT